ncbi:nucleotidyltransferase domain-containing protein [Actinoplanes bogorensis]|uniref:Nucleotidyltransferase domain-containing protein n=1 Tax=Paractinoplanes bogorensis TaxID=1610840 RepID=A0ABS5YT54_9ACTN|nr:nucleotidyltransferase domain-containing protein [Actinoplanes bogorensis]MBU2666628.1 nucleotidyltransferase domain-containing protein [Actinoplanes bogorensis]
MHSDRWRQLIDDRLDEAITVLGRIPGVRGFLVGGSVGRGDPWPMSDIDLLPVYDDRAAEDATRRGQAELVDWWTGSGRAQALDLSWLCFTSDEIRSAMADGPTALATRLGDDPRWFHGIDKAYGGRPSDSDDELIAGFSAWITEVRFHPEVVAARIASWRGQALAAADRGHAADAARALRMVLLESWGERLGSMGREWTRFERMADRHGQRELADRIAVLAGADVAGAAARAEIAPLWLRERIALCWEARRLVGEQVTEAENARDQVAAYAVHVTRHRPDLDGPWTGSAPGDQLAELRRVIDLVVGV